MVSSVQMDLAARLKSIHSLQTLTLRCYSKRKVGRRQRDQHRDTETMALIPPTPALRCPVI